MSVVQNNYPEQHRPNMRRFRLRNSRIWHSEVAVSGNRVLSECGMGFTGDEIEWAPGTAIDGRMCLKCATALDPGIQGEIDEAELRGEL